MKAYKEKITVNGIEVEIAFEFLHKEEPIQIDTINNISVLNFIQPYIDECEDACSMFLIQEAFDKKESLAEARGDEERDSNE